jgi:hypothetical protein
MGKYAPEGDSSVTFGPGGVNCPEGSATAWDAITGECFQVYGLGITIGKASASWQGLYEVFNTNIHARGAQSPVVNPLQLQGVVDV